MSDETKALRPKVGVGVMVLKDGKMLIGQRKSSHGAGEWCFPGGHMEFMESFEGAVKRETLEETGIEIENVRFLRLMNQKKYNPGHYINVAFVADWKSGEPQTLEPDKIAEWQWCDIDNPPSPLFDAIPTCIEAYKTGQNFWDA